MAVFLHYRNVNNANKMIENAIKDVGDFKINRDTLETVLYHYAKAGDLENCQKTFGFFKTIEIELLNHNIFNVIYQLSVNGRFDQCNDLFKYFKANDEMESAVFGAIALFVENRQTLNFIKVINKIMNNDTATIYKHLINEMCRHNVSATEFDATIELIESNGFTMEKHFDTFRPALKCSSHKFIRKMLMHMKMNGLEVTEMSFAKLFDLYASANGTVNDTDVIDVVNMMCVDFKIQPSVVFIRDVILPAILNTIPTSHSTKGISMQPILVTASAKLRNTEILHHRTMNALVNSSLNRCDFQTTIELMNSHKCFYAKKFITETLMNAYASTGDAQNLVRIVKIICRNFSNINDYTNHQSLSDAEIEQKKATFIGEMLGGAISHALNDEKRLLNLLGTFVRVGDDLAISLEQIEKIRQQLLGSLNLSHSSDCLTQIDRLLKRLVGTKDLRNMSSTATAPPATVKRQWQRSNGDIIDYLSAAEIKQTLNEQHAMGRDVTGTEKLLFLAYLREENIPEVEAMISGATTFSGKLNLTNANYAMLVKLYTRNGDLQKALNMLNQACKKDATFKLYPTQLAQLITLMYEQQQQQNKFTDFKEIDALLHIHRPEKTITNQNIPFEKLLQRLAADGHTKYVRTLFDTLIEFRYIQATPDTTGPLVTVHLSNGAYDLAVQTYKSLAKKHKFLPMSIVLFKTLIQNKQNDLLNEAMKIYENVHGKSAAMSHQAFAYSECGQIDEAKAIFQSRSIDDLTKDIGKVCTVYARRDDLDSAKMLLKSTDGVGRCDRRIIYQTILDIYCKYDMADAALELWINLSNDNILPTPKFIDTLAKLLKTNHIALPTDLQAKIKRQNC